MVPGPVVVIFSVVVLSVVVDVVVGNSVVEVVEVSEGVGG